jgi:radical SAM protein with 4Fe4S-binding SPASM domain
MKTYVEARRENRINLAASAPLPKPLAIYIEPTNICNFSSQCYFCAQHTEGYKEKAGYHQNIPMEIVEKVIADIKAMGGVQSIKLHFIGEGTIHPQLGEIARLACTVSNDVMLTTNGTRLFREKAQQLLDSGLHYIRVSIYEETKPATQQTILENVLVLRRLRDEQDSKLRIVVKWLSPNKEFGEWVRNVYSSIVDELIHEELRNFSSAFIAADTLVNHAALTGEQKACALPFYQMIVKANGDVAPCCVAWDQTLNVGNVMQESLLDIWNGKKLAHIHRLHLEGRRKELSTCSTCETLWTNKDSVDALNVEEYNRRREDRAADEVFGE